LAVKWFSLILGRNPRVVTNVFSTMLSQYFYFQLNIQKFVFLSATFQ
jgi:hypothetical protein